MAAHAYNSVCQGVEDSCDRLFYMQLQRDYGYYLHMFSDGSPTYSTTEDTIYVERAYGWYIKCFEAGLL